jgi:hypothetical protein
MTRYWKWQHNSLVVHISEDNCRLKTNCMATMFILIHKMEPHKIWLCGEESIEKSNWIVEESISRKTQPHQSTQLSHQLFFRIHTLCQLVLLHSLMPLAARRKTVNYGDYEWAVEHWIKTICMLQITCTTRWITLCQNIRPESRRVYG